MKRYVCVHGHFYQPPRENPWLEAIERQDSAAPFHDWNERITEECYEPNGRSRILDDDGWIVRIVNNYSRMSFNFGPTLLSWMEARSPEAYQAIIDADRESMERFGGHGSAMAQAYNHMIMPLANERDRRTQVLWGIRDFRKRFGRSPEGMWLPETAMDIATLESLAAHEIHFTLAAPRQAKRMRKLGTEEWIEDEEVDPSRAYLQKLPSGRSIVLFFYDGPISQAVAFERLLNSGVTFSDRIMEAFSDGRDWPQLAHIATDGETYGHHHRHGDMALAFALERIEAHEEVELTNYSAFLEAHPPEWEVEIVEDSSWSCYHGVERWRSDCGCHSGLHAGWNQAWRAPLREALDWLRDELTPLYERKASELLEDPWAARDAYIEVILDRSEEHVARFFARHGKGELSGLERTRAIELLELQRHAMLMYTSCGWFFDDLSGIETVQVIQYAGRAIQIARDALGADLEDAFLSLLEKAESNVRQMGNGRNVYGRQAKPAMIDLPAVAAHSAISSLFEENGEPARDVYCYETSLDVERDLRAGHVRLRIGRVDVASRVTHRSGSFRFAVAHLGEHIVSGGVAPVDQMADGADFPAKAEAAFKSANFVELLKLIEGRFGSATYSLESLFRDQQRSIVERLLETTIDSVRSTYQGIYERHAPLLRFHAGLNIPPPRELVTAAEFVFNAELNEAVERAAEHVDRIGDLLEEAESEEIPLDEERLTFTIEATLERLAEEWLEAPERLDRVEDLGRAVDVAQQLPFEVDLEAAQRVVYDMIGLRREVAGETAERAQWIESFDRLAERVRVRVEL